MYSEWALRVSCNVNSVYLRKAGPVNEPSLLDGAKQCDDDALEGFDMLALN
jgi:hypothetical protein